MATKIDASYLKNTCNYDIKEELRSELISTGAALESIFNNVYAELCILAFCDDCTVQTTDDIEARLDTNEKKEFFRKAQAYQLIYELRSGKNTLFIPDSFSLDAKSYDWNRDTLRIMRNVLGFNHPTLFTQRG